MTLSILIIFIKGCYKRPSFQSYNKIAIVKVKRLKQFYPDDLEHNCHIIHQYIITLIIGSEDVLRTKLAAHQCWLIPQ